jgi:hypothetical protein
VSAVEIIEAIKALTPEQRAEVMRFAAQFETVEQLAPEQLGELADRLAAANDPEEAARLEKEIVRGFYGAKLDVE